MWQRPTKSSSSLILVGEPSGWDELVPLREDAQGEWTLVHGKGLGRHAHGGPHEEERGGYNHRSGDHNDEGVGGNMEDSDKGNGEGSERGEQHEGGNEGDAEHEDGEDEGCGDEHGDVREHERERERVRVRARGASKQSHWSERFRSRTSLPWGGSRSARGRGSAANATRGRWTRIFGASLTSCPSLLCRVERLLHRDRCYCYCYCLCHCSGFPFRSPKRVRQLGQEVLEVSRGSHGRWVPKFEAK